MKAEDSGEGGDMRRGMALVGLIALGVLAGFVARLIWPRRDIVPVYRAPAPPEY